MATKHIALGQYELVGLMHDWGIKLGNSLTEKGEVGGDPVGIETVAKRRPEYHPAATV